MLPDGLTYVTVLCDGYSSTFNAYSPLFLELRSWFGNNQAREKKILKGGNSRETQRLCPLKEIRAAGINLGVNPGRPESWESAQIQQQLLRIPWAGQFLVSWRDLNQFLATAAPPPSCGAMCQRCPVHSWSAHLFWGGSFGVDSLLEFSGWAGGSWQVFFGSWEQIPPSGTLGWSQFYLPGVFRTISGGNSPESSRGGTFPVALSRTELHFSFLYKYIYIYSTNSRGKVML